MAIQYGNKKAKKIIYPQGKKNVQADALAEVNTVRQAFIDKAKAEKDLFEENVDANYFTVVYFNNSGQLDEFLKKAGIKTDDKQFIDGKKLARLLGVLIETPDRKTPGNFKINKNIIDLTL
jgi:hypothetical protein